MRLVSVLGICGVLLSTVLIGRTHAQYIFIDTDQDGVATTKDVISVRDSTQIDIWLCTDRNKDGTKAGYRLDPSQPLDMFSYEFILHASGGKVRWGKYTNKMSDMDFEFGTDRGPSDFYTGYLGSTPFPPGKYKLGSLWVSVTAGTPTLSFASTAPFLPPVRTSIGSHCAGKDGDNTLKFTENASAVGTAGPEVAGDWTGADGVSAPSNAASLADRIKSTLPPHSMRPTVSPNPSNPTAELTFWMPAPGFARVRVYCAGGELVRSLLDEASLPAGTHRVAIDRPPIHGKGLPSGVYYYEIETPAGRSHGRFVILK